jgi:hypothetical protein
MLIAPGWAWQNQKAQNQARKTVCLAGFTAGFNEPADQFELG